MPAADTAKLVASLSLDDKGFTKGIDRASKKASSFDKTLGRIGDKAGKGLGTAAKNLEHIGVGLGVGAIAGLGAAVKVAADFQAQLNTINTVAGLTGPELAKVGDNLRGLAKGTGTDLDDLTAAFYDLVSAGISAKDAMGVLTAANTLAIGGLGTTAETVDLLTTAINAYGLDASAAAKVADMFAESIAAGKITASQLAESFAVIGPSAAAAGVGIDELAAGFAVATASGTKAASAAAAMRAALTGLTNPNAKLNKIQKETGVNFAKLAKNKGLVFALNELRKRADKANIPLGALLGQVEGVNFALQTTGPNFDKYNAELAKVGKSSGRAADQMSERQQGLSYQLNVLKANAKDAGIIIGNALLPKLTPLAAKAVAFLQVHEADIQAFGDKIAGAFDKAIDFANKIPWGAVASGLQASADWAGKLVDAFLALPPEFQTTIIALAGLNKLSGGAITGIVGELGKGLIKGVLGMNAGVVNINAGVVNGVGGGVPGAAPAAAAGGLTAGAVATTAAVGVVLVGGTVVSLNQIATEAGKNNLLAAKGLTQQEIIAQKYYNANKADQDRIFKQLHGVIPPESVFTSGNAKLDGIAANIRDGGKLQNVANERLEANNAVARAAKAAASADSRSEKATIDAASAAAKTRQDAIKQAAAATAAAIRAKDLSVVLTNYVSVSTHVSVANDLNAKNNYKSVYRVAT